MSSLRKTRARLSDDGVSLISSSMPRRRVAFHILLAKAEDALVDFAAHLDASRNQHHVRKVNPALTSS